MQHRQEIGLEVGSTEGDLVLVKTLANGYLDNLVQLQSIGLQFLHVQFGGDDNLVLLEHLYHTLGGIEEGVQRATESVKTAFQAFDHVGLVDGCQRVGHLFGFSTGGYLV